MEGDLNMLTKQEKQERSKKRREMHLRKQEEGFQVKCRTLHHLNSTIKADDRLAEDLEEAKQYTDSVPKLRKGSHSYSNCESYVKKSHWQSKPKYNDHRDRNSIRKINTEEPDVEEQGNE